MKKTRFAHVSVKDAFQRPPPFPWAGRELLRGADGATGRRGFAPNMPGKTLFVSVALAIAIVLWAVVNLAIGWTGFALVVPVGFRGSGEMAISIARLFAALVLILSVADGLGDRLRWVAAGFIVLGLGQFAFGYLEPVVVESPNVNRSLYEMILVRSLAGALIVAGLLPRRPLRFSWRSVAVVIGFCAFCIAGYWLFGRFDMVPQLVQIESLEQAARLRIAPMSWMTGWHWALAIPAFGLAVTAAVAALKRNQRGEIGSWLPLAMVLLAGSELHDVLWPSAYSNSALINTADLLRLAMAAVVVVGGTLELKRIADERSALLAAETERVRRLEELATLKADFTAMVAHELGHPLSAIRRQAELLAYDGLDDGMRTAALDTIITETDALDTLVTDVQASATVERDDFGAELRQVPVGALVKDVLMIADAYDPDRQLDVVFAGVEAHERVLADRVRVGQVLRNLLCNAAKYSSRAAPIALRVVAGGHDRVRLEVSDHGPGIAPDDLIWIFDKFERGSNGKESDTSGTGVGLYLSRRIVRAHGSDLTVTSSPGAGSVFTFELRKAPERVMG